MSVDEPSGTTNCRPERRTFKRIRLYLPGTLFNPVNDEEFVCNVLNLSAGGAAVQCDGNFLRGDTFVLHVTGLGRFEGSVVRHENGVLRLVFVIGASKQNRLKEMLSLFLAEGLTGVTQSRKHEREPSIGSGFIIQADGLHLKCDVLDVSLEGISLRTRTRPPIGTMVSLGCNSGKVVRHHPEGIAIQFMKAVPDTLLDAGSVSKHL